MGNVQKRWLRLLKVRAWGEWRGRDSNVPGHISEKDNSGSSWISKKAQKNGPYSILGRWAKILGILEVQVNGFIRNMSSAIVQEHPWATGLPNPRLVSPNLSHGQNSLNLVAQ